MELDTAFKLKRKLEEDIFAQTMALCRNFTEETELDVTDIYFTLQDVSEMGLTKAITVFTCCSTTVEL